MESARILSTSDCSETAEAPGGHIYPRPFDRPETLFNDGLMSIQDLIAEKRKQVAVLERHIKMLESMAKEEGTGGRARTDQSQPTAGPKGRRGRRRSGKSRAAMVEAYLKGHSSPQPAREIASALGLKAAELHGAVHAGLKTGRFVRGKQRATFGLGTAAITAGESPAKRQARARRPTKRKGGKSAKAAATGGTA
jgi:hypothetical protein